MADKELIIEEKFENTGVFDFKEFYKYAHSWLKDEKYDVTEEKYSEKVSGNTRDITIEWSATKTLSDYFKVDIKIEFTIEKLADVEVEIDGERKKMNKGKVAGKIKGNLIKDHDSKWETSPSMRFFRDVYNKYIIPARVSNMEEVVRRISISFKEELKAFLEMSGRRK